MPWMSFQRVDCEGGPGERDQFNSIPSPLPSWKWPRAFWKSAEILDCSDGAGFSNRNGATVRRRQAPAVTRLLRILRANGLIKKVHRTRRYLVVSQVHCNAPGALTPALSR